MRSKQGATQERKDLREILYRLPAKTFYAHVLPVSKEATCTTIFDTYIMSASGTFYDHVPGSFDCLTWAGVSFNEFKMTFSYREQVKINPF